MQRSNVYEEVGLGSSGQLPVSSLQPAVGSGQYAVGSRRSAAVSSSLQRALGWNFLGPTNTS